MCVELIAEGRFAKQDGGGSFKHSVKAVQHLLLRSKEAQADAYHACYLAMDSMDEATELQFIETLLQPVLTQGLTLEKFNQAFHQYYGSLFEDAVNMADAPAPKKRAATKRVPRKRALKETM